MRVTDECDDGPMHDRVLVRELTDADRAEIATWRYPGALSIYDPGDGAAALRSPDHVAFTDEHGVLLGYGTLGAEARVPGGCYDVDEATVDVGIGLKPDRIGHGIGRPALEALAGHACRLLSADRLRATVAASNPRATAFVRAMGFEEFARFVRGRDQRAFIIYTRPAGG